MLADEVNQQENSPETQSGNQNRSDVEQTGEDMVSRARVTELEGLVAGKDEELAQVIGRIDELEQTIASKDDEIVSLRQSQAELEEGLSTSSKSLGEVIASYRSMVVQTNPEVMEELISGDTVEAISESLEKAKSLIGKVRRGLETEISLARVPAGATERRAPDLSALSPSEKIQYAIGGRK